MLAITLVALTASSMLPPDRLEIAKMIAGDGRPDCIRYDVDGSSGPCLPVFETVPGRRINAWQNGWRVSFTQAAVQRISRDEFALLAGHEIAHFYLEHKGPSNPADELAADLLGAQLACQAGFNPAAGASLFRLLLHAGTTHPPRAVRRAAVLAVPCPKVQ